MDCVEPYDSAHGRPGLRRAELVSALSLGSDLGWGQPMEHVLRSCLIGMRLAQACRLNESDRVDVFYSTLLAWVGCHADSHELSLWFGDDIAFRSEFAAIDKAASRCWHSCSATWVPGARYTAGVAWPPPSSSPATGQ